MKVHELLTEIGRQLGGDLDAEVLADGRPCIRVTRGRFVTGPMAGQPWVSIQGTDVWGAYHPSGEARPRLSVLTRKSDGTETLVPLVSQ